MSPRLRRTAPTLAVAVAMLGMATAFAVPYRDAERPASPPVAEYLGTYDGGGSLSRRDEDTGVTWASSTSWVVPDFNLASHPARVQESVADRLGIDGFSGSLPGADLLLASVVEHPADGPATERQLTMLLDGSGWALVAVVQDGSDPVVFDPALPLLPADPLSERTWSESGTLSHGAVYGFSAEVVETGPAEVALGAFDDCFTVVSELAIGPPDTPTRPDRYVERYCRGAGLVEAISESPEAGRSRAETVAVTGHLPVDSPPLSAVDPPDGGIELGEDPWVFATVVNPTGGIQTPKPTILPELVLGKEPTLVVATEGQAALRAVRVAPEEDQAASAWQHATDGLTYGGVLFDPASGRVFAGSAGGTVHAMTSDGLFLWGVDVGDNVATRPVLSQGTLVVGSEDGDIVGLDPDDGQVRWRTGTDGPVTASPALLGELVVTAGDDGVVRALDAGDGAVVWEYDTGAPVEADVTALSDAVLVATRNGTVSRLDAEGGEEWTADTTFAIRTAPTAAGSVAVVVSGEYGGDLVGVDLDSGEIAWRRRGSYAGPVAAVSGRAAFVAAEREGALVAFDEAGEEVERWPLPPSPTAIFSGGWQITVGPVAAAGALWVVDEYGRVVRLGPSDGGGAEQVEELAPAWIVPVSDDPFGFEILRSTPVVTGEAVYVLSGTGAVVRLDPGTGEVEQAGVLELDDSAAVVLPTPTDGETLYVAAQGTVAALELPGGTRRWGADIPGMALQPPVLAGGSLVVPSSGEGQHHVSVFDIRSGALRWHEVTGTGVSDSVAAGVAVVDGLVVSGDPFTGRRVSDGSTVWESEVGDSVGPVTAVPGTDLVVGATATLAAGAERGALVALDAGTGDVVWQVELPDVLADPLSDLLVVPTDGGQPGVVVVQSVDGRTVMGVETETGAELWRRELPATRFGVGALLGGRAWFPMVDGRLVALDPMSGAVRARSADLGVDLADSALAQRPVLVDGTVVAVAGLVVLGIPTGGGS